jgi:hypothetical protein
MFACLFQVECYLWTPFNKKYRYGRLYISQNFACFQSHVPGLVALVIPLRDVAHVEKTDSHPNGNTVDDAIVVTMKSNATLIFAQLPDRDFVVEKLSELLLNSKVLRRSHMLLIGQHGVISGRNGGWVKHRKLVGNHLRLRRSEHVLLGHDCQLRAHRAADEHFQGRQ